MTSRKGKTAAELMAELEANPEYVERRKQREEELSHRRRFLDRAEAPLVRDLRMAGSEVNSVWDLVGTTQPYPEAIPVLMEHLERAYPAKIKEGIARALAVPVLGPEDWEILVAHFLGEEDGEAKWALALAVEKNAREHNREQLIGLVGDPTNGKGRSVLAEALYRFRNEEVSAVLHSLEADPEIGASITRLLRTGTTIVD